MDFVAIDFETATQASDSPCQLAAVVVRGGEIVDEHCWLIRPRPFRFAAQNIAIHGIVPDDVRHAPEFDVIWKEVSHVVAGACLVAHNARFDLNVLRRTLQQFRLPVPDLQFSCTRLIARRCWPGRGRYGLKPTASWLGIQFRHHDALEDSRACAGIALAAAESRGARTLEQLEERLGIARGEAAFWGINSPRAISTERGRALPAMEGTMPRRRPRRQQVSGSNRDITAIPMTPLLAAAQANRCWVGKRVVFTGRLRKLARSDAQRLARAMGAECQSSVTRQTQVLVVGSTDERTVAAGRSRSTKEERVAQLRNEGASIEVVTEAAFFHLLGLQKEQPLDLWDVCQQ